MSKSTYYRFLSGDKGIYEAVDLDCPRSDSRRAHKPDGSWLPKIGTQFPGAISFWTEAGLKRYLESGLQDWHRRVVKNPVHVQILHGEYEALYSDELQIICKPEIVKTYETLSWENFAILKAHENLIDKVVAYVTRSNNGQKELLVFDHEKQWNEAGIQVPAGTVDRGEALETALLREIEEESGLKNLQIVKKVDEYIFYRVPHQQFNKRHVFELKSQDSLPHQWSHKVTGNGEDHQMIFHYYWLPLDEAELELSGGLGDSAKKLAHS